MIEVRQLDVAYDHRLVLRSLDLCVKSGEIVALVGPNGVGKTTLIRAIASLLKPTAGQIWVAGYLLPHHANQIRQCIGTVLHQFLLYPDLTAEENLRFYGRLYGLQDLNKRITEVFNVIDLIPNRGEMVRYFSRGMQQRLAIGRAILHDPKILLLDEPYTGLDPQAVSRLDELVRLLAESERTILMSTHDLGRAASVASRVDILSAGSIQASISRHEDRWQQLESMYHSLTHG